MQQNNYILHQKYLTIELVNKTCGLCKYCAGEKCDKHIRTYFDEVWLVPEGQVEGAVARGQAEDAGLVIALKPLARPLQQVRSLMKEKHGSS